jgi:glycosyltransferase involved in cell wall biosynthesis
MVARKIIVFYDAASPAAYSSDSLCLPNNGIGGAEATVIRVAEKLAEKHEVIVAQSARLNPDSSERSQIRWISTRDVDSEILRSDVVVVQRRIQHSLTIRMINKHVPLFIWYHDWYFPASLENSIARRLMAKMKTETRVALHYLNRATAIGVSQSHAQSIRAHLDEAVLFRTAASRIRVEHIYNPISDELNPANLVYDPTKLIFFSAAWKGLALVLKAFNAVRQAMPDMKLYIASPGYSQIEDQLCLLDPNMDERSNPDHYHLDRSIIVLGTLSQLDLMRQVETALCVFYPADRIPETFGLVFAESHAVGTPVLAHPFGAATELLLPEELVDSQNSVEVVQRIRSWRNGGRPKVSARKDVRLSKVGERWERVLFEADDSP